MVTSAEVLQELLHAYLPVGRIGTFDAALKLAIEGTDHIFAISAETVLFARHLADKHPGLTAMDLRKNRYFLPGPRTVTKEP